MSYDIRICVRTEAENNYGERYAVVYVPICDSPTYDLSPIFNRCMRWDYVQGVAYPLADVMPRLRRGLAELTEHPDKYRKLEPENRWGTVESAVRCIESWIAELEDGLCGPTSDWPLEALWWRW